MSAFEPAYRTGERVLYRGREASIRDEARDAEDAYVVMFPGRPDALVWHHEHARALAPAGSGDAALSVPVGNPGPAWWPSPEWVTPDMEGPAPSTLLPCGCHLRRPDYEAVLCPTHLAELNETSTRTIEGDQP